MAYVNIFIGVGLFWFGLGNYHSEHYILALIECVLGALNVYIGFMNLNKNKYDTNIK